MSEGFVLKNGRTTKTTLRQYNASLRKKKNRARNKRAWDEEAKRLGISLSELLSQKQEERDKIVKNNNEDREYSLKLEREMRIKRREEGYGWTSSYYF